MRWTSSQASKPSFVRSDYRVVKRSLENAVKPGSGETYPEPVSHCDICRWWKECNTRRRRDDHLSFVAGASRLQRKELVLQDTTTLGTPDRAASARVSVQMAAAFVQQLWFAINASGTKPRVFHLIATRSGEPECPNVASRNTVRSRSRYG